MIFGRSLVLALPLAVLVAGAVACGGTSSRSATFDGDNGGGGGGGSGGGSGGDTGGTPAFGNTDGGAATGTAVCAPGPGNYEVPNNGCDDDGDGTVDNADVACDTGLSLTGDAPTMAKAMGLCNTAKDANDSKWGVISASYTRGYNETSAPADGQHGILQKFGSVVKSREGKSLGVLSSGYAREFDSSSNASSAFKGIKSAMTNQGSVPPGFPKKASGCDQATDVHDVAALKLQIKVPDNAQGIAFDFDFYSGEWPEYVCTQFNDGFIAYLTSAAFNNGKADNISFDSQNNPVSVNNGFFDRCTPNSETACLSGGIFGGSGKMASCPGGESELNGTGFLDRGTYCSQGPSSGGGATGWLTSTAPVKPGEVITLEFMIWDSGDTNYDSSVLLDHLTWLPTPTETKTDRPK